MAKKPTAADKLRAQLEQAQQPQPINDPTPTHIDGEAPAADTTGGKTKKPRKTMISCYIAPQSYTALIELAKYRTKYKSPCGYGELVDDAIKAYLDGKKQELEIWREYEAKLPPIPDIPE